MHQLLINQVLNQLVCETAVLDGIKEGFNIDDRCPLVLLVVAKFEPNVEAHADLILADCQVREMRRLIPMCDEPIFKGCLVIVGSKDAQVVVV